MKQRNFIFYVVLYIIINWVSDFKWKFVQKGLGVGCHMKTQVFLKITSQRLPPQLEPAENHGTDVSFIHQQVNHASNPVFTQYSTTAIEGGCLLLQASQPARQSLSLELEKLS